MNIQTPFKRIVLVTLAFALSSFVRAEMLEPGDAFPAIKAEDQHEKAFPMPTNTKHIAVTFAMGSGKKANKFFSDKGAEYLPNNNAVFLSNIFGMPGIARVFALPKMQKYPHRIMLADEKGLLDNFPEEKGMVTVFTLDDQGKIKSIKFWNPATGKAPF